jgi:flavocytochrome c
VTDYDVAVIGSGVAGVAAALIAAEAGASVLVAEAEGYVGGSSRLSGAMLMGAGTRAQVAEGIDDHPDEMYRHYMTLNQWKPEPALIRRLSDDAATAIHWLDDLGVEFEDKLLTSGEEGIPRLHRTVGEGAAVMEVLHRRSNEAGVEIALGQRVDRLLVGKGQVTGIAVGDDELTAGAVVVATGGFGSNRELVSKLLPQFDEVGDWFWYIGDPSARGDAFGLGSQVGAQLTGFGRGASLLTPNFGNLLEGGYFPGWLVMVNAQGRRFFDETSPYSITQPIVEGQEGPVFAIFDDPARREAQPSTAEAVKKINLPHRSGRTQKWVQSMLDEMIERGVVVQADTLEELAERLSVPAEHLAGTIERYNGDTAAGRDSQYLKRADLMRVVATPPFYATELRLAHLTVTGVGLRIDAETHVLDERSLPIDGLFAAGECTGGVVGDVYVGSGNSFTSCVVFGRVAGRSAAEWAAAKTASAEAASPSGR